MPKSSEFKYGLFALLHIKYKDASQPSKSIAFIGFAVLKRA